MSMQAWFTMGGYAWFVWPSYFIGLVVLIWSAYIPLRRHRRLMNKLIAGK